MAAQAEYTIDELARAADTTVRSVRVYHERGLLPSPEVRGRIGYYDSDHLDRLQTISRLLGRGMRLNGIRELLDAWDRGDGLADVLGVPGEIPELPPTAADQPAPAQHMDPDPLHTYATTIPQCCDLATRLIDSGLPDADAFEVIEALRADCDRIAQQHAATLFFYLAGKRFSESDGSPRARTKLDTDLAITRLLATRAAAELLDQAFARYTEHPRAMTRPHNSSTPIR
ncbi:MerR family transcriptional regulator [Nocardia sp. NPDC051832]|uniref:MerR family transcriptional regulator n=1 Tax=Nocardia sp. NPDC051832 TaxID=3155673 RepID=UPI0034187868